MIAYRASFNGFDEMVFDDGLVVRRIETPHGGTYSVVAEGVTPDDFMVNEGSEGEWYEVSEEEAAYWRDAVKD